MSFAGCRRLTCVALAALAALAFTSSMHLGSAAQYLDWRSGAVPTVSLHQAHQVRPRPLSPTTQPQPVNPQPLAQQAAPAVKAEGAATTICPSEDATQWHPAPLGGNGLNQMLDAVRLSRYAGSPNPVAGCPTMTAGDSANWDLAYQLVASVPQSAEDLQMEQETATVDREQRQQAAKGASPPPPPPPVEPSPPPPPPPPPCSGTAEECMFELVRSVPVHDYETGRHVVPQQHHLPPGDIGVGARQVGARPPQWDESGTIWSCRGQDCEVNPGISAGVP